MAANQVTAMRLAGHAMQPAFRRARGFTLIELMVVVAIIAILAAIAYPSYVEYVRKARRAQAKADLMELTQQAERYRTAHNHYTGWTLPFDQSPRDGSAQYSLTVDNLTAGTYSIKATPTAGALQADDKCGTLTIDQSGMRRSGPSGTTVNADCF